MIYEKNLPVGTPNPSYKVRAISDTGASENVAYDELLGVMVAEYLTYADLPNPGNVNNHYKVTQDPTAAKNGIYHWDGTDYVKDADLNPDLDNKISDNARMVNEIVPAQNLINSETSIAGYYVYWPSGALSSNASYDASDWIIVKPSTDYYGNQNHYAFYDENKNYLSGNNSGGLITSPSTAKYVRVSYATGGDAYLNEGNTDLGYSDYKLKCDLFQIKGSQISDKIGYEKTDFVEVGNNLFNPETAVLDEFISTTTGEPVSSDNWWHSDYIQVKENTIYSSKVGFRDYAFYDFEKRFISGAVGIDHQMTTPTNAAYIRLSQYPYTSTDSHSPAKFMFNEGAEALPFEIYVNQFKYNPERFGTKPIIQLPKYIDAVVGDTLQLYYSSLIAFPNWQQFYFVSTLSGAHDLKRYLEFTPTAAGDKTLTIYMYDKNQVLISSASTTIRVREAVEQPSSAINFWTVGDSLTNAPTYTDEMVRRLTGTGGTPAGNGFGNIINHREGNSGKEWNWYVTNEDSPFVYSGALDFEQYRVDNNLAVPDVLYILLTWNGMGKRRTQEEWDTWDDDVYTFLDALKSDFSDVKVKLCSPQFPSQIGGLGHDYGATLDSYSDLLLQNTNALKQAEIYERITTESNYSGWVEHIATALQVDSLYNMPHIDKAVNTRNSSITERIGSGGVHPLPEGYYQIADALYRNFILNYCQ